MVSVKWNQIEDMIANLSEEEVGKISFMDTMSLKFMYGKSLFDKDQIVVENVIQIYFNEKFLFVSKLTDRKKYKMIPDIYEKLLDLISE